MTLSTFAVLLGAGFSLPQAYALIKPASFTEQARKFPRSEPWGYLLMAIGTIWFLNNLNKEAISDFAAYKRYMLIGFGAIGLLTCIFVKDFLAVRGLAVTLLMLSWYTLYQARWAETPWRLVLVVAAYIWIIGGMWFTVSPWRLRDIIAWMTENPTRLRIGAGVRLAFGILVILLGVLVF